MSNIALDFKIDFITLDDTPKSELKKIGETLAEWLARDTGKEPIKFWSWALALHKGDSVNFDDSDFKKLYEWIEKHEAFTAAFKAQCLLYMDEEKSKKNKKE